MDSPSFWGGEVEILILSKMLHVPIHVMQRAQEAGRYGTQVLTALIRLRLHACLLAHFSFYTFLLCFNVLCNVSMHALGLQSTRALH